MRIGEKTRFARIWPSASKIGTFFEFRRAENGGLDPSWLNLAFLGRPDFQSRGPQMLVLKGFRTSGLKIGAPQKRQIQPRRIQPPILGPLKLNRFVRIDSRESAKRWGANRQPTKIFFISPTP